MIFVWIGNIVSFIKYLFVPPETIIPKRNPNAPCPNCGWGKGSLSASFTNSKPQVQHNCKICSATWYEDPVLKAPDKIQVETPKE